jgi:hypothetical protein
MPDFEPGQTVQLTDGRKGIVRFFGQTHFQVGDWIGIELEEKTGKNDGSVRGERYFDCPMGYGMFVKPMMATIVAPVPAAKPAPTKKPARPSSFNPGAARVSIGADPAAARRKSINAPSPSPIPRTRPSSIARVGAPAEHTKLEASRILTSSSVPYQVPDQANQWPAERLCISNRYSVPSPSSFSRIKSPPCRYWSKNVHGTTCGSWSTCDTTTLNIFRYLKDEQYYDETDKHSHVHRGYTASITTRPGTTTLGRFNVRPGKRQCRQERRDIS